jgi:hypothetical protein
MIDAFLLWLIKMNSPSYRLAQQLRKVANFAENNNYTVIPTTLRELADNVEQQGD